MFFCCKVNKQSIKRICPSEEVSSKRQRVSHVNKNNNIVMKESVKKSSVVERLSKTNLNDSNKLSTAVKKEDAESSLSGNLGELKSRDYIRSWELANRKFPTDQGDLKSNKITANQIKLLLLAFEKDKTEYLTNNIFLQPNGQTISQ